MWTKADFEQVLARHPEGGTFWTGTKRCVRYMRVHRDGDTIIAVMTQHCGFRGHKESSVSIFVKDSRGSRVSHFADPTKTGTFAERLQNATALLWVRAGRRIAARDFMSSPPRESMPEMFPLW